MAMEELADIDPERARIVEMRYFGGMSLGRIGEVRGLSEATVKRRLVVTRAWLQDRLENSVAPGSRPARDSRHPPGSRRHWKCGRKIRGAISKRTWNRAAPCASEHCACCPRRNCRACLSAPAVPPDTAAK